jgi:hypothetical protein
MRNTLNILAGTALLWALNLRPDFELGLCGVALALWLGARWVSWLFRTGDAPLW